MWHRPSRWTLAAFAFAVAAGFIAWLVMGSGERTMRLADGREFSIFAVTYGTNHVLEQGPPWARLIARFGSRSTAYRFGYRSTGPYPSPVPSIMIWTRWLPGNSNAPPRFASVAGVNGFETEPVDTTAHLGMSANSNGVSVAWRFENYPQLQKEFTLRFYEYDLFRVRGRREGEVTVRNRARMPKAASPAPTAPLTGTNGLLESTLVSLRCGGPPPRRPLTAKSAIAPWAMAEFEFRENGQPTTNWTVKRIEAFGATGNYISGDRLVVELETGRRVAHFTGAFWPDETDWRLVAHVVPTRNFPKESLCTVRVPTEAFVRDLFVTNLQAEAYGFRNSRLSLAPDIVGLRGEVASGKSAAFLRVDYTPASPDLYLDLASATDDQGREILVAHPLASRKWACEADLKFLHSAQFVDLTFAIHRSRTLGFRVRPEIVSTNTASTFPAAGK
jgi:hypothetical protein